MDDELFKISGIEASLLESPYKFNSIFSYFSFSFMIIEGDFSIEILLLDFSLRINVYHCRAIIQF